MLSRDSSNAILRTTLLIVTVCYVVVFAGISYRSGHIELPDRPLFFLGGTAIFLSWILSARHARMAWAVLLAALTFTCALAPAMTTGTRSLGFLMVPTLMTLAAYVFSVKHAMAVLAFSSTLLVPTVYLEISGLTNTEMASTPARGLIILGVWIGFAAVLITILKQTNVQHSAMQLAEERLRIAVETLQDGFVLYDENDRLVMCNQRYREFYPAPSGAVMPGARYEDMLRARVHSGFYVDAKGNEEAWLKRHLAKRRVKDEISIFRTSEGRWLRVTNQSTATGGLVGITTDVTELKKAQETLQEAQKMEAIGQLTGGLAHDFNNLLGIVVGNLDELGERLPANDPVLARHQALALEAALRGAEVTRSLLSVARRQPMEVRQYNLDQLIDEMLPLLRTSAGASISVIHDRAPATLLCRLDAQGLSNACLNLVINARDAMAASKERRITIRARQEAAKAENPHGVTPGQYAAIEIEDTGSGMSESVRLRALEPFFTTKARTKGTGLGLSMVYGYAKQLGGTASISSVEGQGTTVSILLPLEAAPG